MCGTANIKNLLQPLVGQRIRECVVEIGEIYGGIRDALTASDFDKSHSGLKFASMEKDLVGRKALEVEEWFRQNVKRAAMKAGMTEVDAQLYWSKIYYVLPTSMPEIAYIGVSEIDAITSTRKVLKRFGGWADAWDHTDIATALGGTAVMTTVGAFFSRVQTKNPKIRLAAAVGSGLAGCAGALAIRVRKKLSLTSREMEEETFIDEAELERICGERSRYITECFEKWLRDGCRLAIGAWPE